MILRSTILGEGPPVVLMHGLFGQALNTKYHFNFNCRLLIDLFFYVPLPVSGLTPAWPVQRDVRNNARRQAFARQTVGGFPYQVTKQNVGL